MRTFITGNDVEIAHSVGQAEIVVHPYDVVTGVAREVATRLGVRIVTASLQGGPAAPSRPGGPGGPPSPFPVSAPSHVADAPAYDIAAWRKRFPILERYIHVANCSQSPQSSDTRAAAEAYLQSWEEMGMDWDRWIEEVMAAKAEFARLINADVSDIAIGTSLSELTSTVASSLCFDGSRTKVVVTDAEFPTVGHVWLGHQKYGAKVQFLPVKNGMIDPSEYARYVDGTTLITSICDVYYYNGFKQDLASIVPTIHEKGSLVYLDAYQGIGTHPIDVKALDVDFLGTGNLKYLMGIPGVAFLYVKPELVPHLTPAVTGWFGQQNPFAFDIHHLDYASDARRFDNGTPPVVTAYIARAGMHIINEVGVAKIQAWIDRLSRHCLDGAEARGLQIASPRDIRCKGATTAIRVPGSSHDVEAALRKKQVIASARSDVVRIAPHFFTRLEDLDYVLDCFVEVLHP